MTAVSIGVRPSLRPTLQRELRADPIWSLPLSVRYSVIADDRAGHIDRIPSFLKARYYLRITYYSIAVLR